MREVAFYRATLGLPILIPPFALFTQYFLALAGYSTTWFATFSFFLGASLVVGGLPYLVIAACWLLVLRRRGPRAWRWSLLVAPIVFSCVIGLLALLHLNSGTQDFTVQPLFTYGTFALAIGFGYALPVLAAGALLSRLGFFAPSQPPAA